MNIANNSQDGKDVDSDIEILSNHEEKEIQETTSHASHDTGNEFVTIDGVTMTNDGYIINDFVKNPWKRNAVYLFSRREKEDKNGKRILRRIWGCRKCSHQAMSGAIKKHLEVHDGSMYYSYFFILY